MSSDTPDLDVGDELQAPGASSGAPEEEEKESGVTPAELLGEVAANGPRVVVEWHERLMRVSLRAGCAANFWVQDPPSCDNFLLERNSGKNRYPNIMLYDRSRVVLTDKLGEDYIHASWVDSYEKSDGYILAQAPFDEDTETDFWRMVHQTRPCLIVLLSSLNGTNNQRQIKGFWPGNKQERAYCDDALKVKCARMDTERDYDMYTFNTVLSRGKSKSQHSTMFMHYRKWVADQDIPDNLLEFRAMVKINAARAEKENHGEQVMFVCPSGVHRCGVFACMDIVLDRMTSEKKVGGILAQILRPMFEVGVKQTVLIMRRQRYGLFHKFNHYAHVADIAVRHAVSSGFIDANAIGNRKH